MDAATAALKKADIRGFEAALARDPNIARKPQVILTAARLCRIDVFETLVEHGADLNASWRGYRALHSLIQGESVHGEVDGIGDRRQCLAWLLAHGADPEQAGAWPPARAILVAAFAGIEPFVAALREAGARIDVFAACTLGDVRAVRRALEKDGDLGNHRDGKGGLTTLQCAAGSRMGRSEPTVQRRLVEIATMLLDCGADPNARTKSWRHAIDAAYLAVSSRNAGILEALLAHGADATEALSAAAWQKVHSLAELVMRHGARMDEALSNGLPLLNDLVRWGQIRQALWLLERGANPNRPDSKGWTSVHQAASRGNERIFRALLDKGGDPWRKDVDGLTPLDIARAKGRINLPGAWRSD